jgi:N-acetylneuraminate synthase
MVQRTRELEYSLGNSIKNIEDNEQDTVIVQRRCLRASIDLKADTILTEDMIDILRPAPKNSIPPYEFDMVIGKKILDNIPKGAELNWSNIR